MELEQEKNYDDPKSQGMTILPLGGAGVAVATDGGETGAGAAGGVKVVFPRVLFCVKFSPPK